MLITVLAAAAAVWGLVMAIAPLLQIRRMLRRRCSADVSVGYPLLLLPGFCLWVAYGIVSADAALIIPNSAATVVATVTVLIALRLRGSGDDRPAGGDPVQA